MLITVVELDSFLAFSTNIISENERANLIYHLARNPKCGVIIPKTGGLRKLRWTSKDRGKRGGIRVIYYFYNENFPIYLLTIYGKGVQEDISHEMRKKMALLCKKLKEEFKKKGVE